MSLSFTSWSFDAAQYSPGSTITLTVQYSSTDELPADEITSAVTVAATDATSGTVSQTSDVSGNFPPFTVATASSAPEPVEVSASDARTAPGTWALVSNAFTTTASPFLGTAVLTSLA